MTIQIPANYISHSPKWDKIFLSVYLRQLCHGPKIYQKQLAILEATP